MNFQNELQKYYADVLSLPVIKNYKIVEIVVEGINKMSQKGKQLYNKFLRI